jgi:dimethylhistidine N-methyltransferase
MANPVFSRIEDDDFASSVIAGLTCVNKHIPCRFFYDERGSALFEEITRQPEYYLTRAEASILDAHGEAMVENDGEMVLVEFGSGSSLKTERLLRASPNLYAYVPIDVSVSALLGAESRLRGKFPNLRISPLLADFTRRIDFDPTLSVRRKIGFFPGSTIGNFAPFDAIRLLRSIRRSLSAGGRLLIGVDLKKDVGQLLCAYNDAGGVTAQFNINIVNRINRELGANFDLGSFRHEAIYSEQEGRIEMRLVSERRQQARVLDRSIYFDEGEVIHTENSYKYSIDEFRRLARSAGWTPQRVWTDDRRLFSLHELLSSGAY